VISDPRRDIEANIEKITSEIGRLERAAKHSQSDPARLREITAELRMLRERRSLLQNNAQTAL
jgi:hypothetical protein